MAEYGAQFINDTGRVSLDSSFANYFFHTKASVYMGDGATVDFNLGVPTSDLSAPMIFYQPEDKYGLRQLFQSGGNWFVRCCNASGGARTINLIIFRRRYLSNPGGYGFMLRDATGNITFNSSDNSLPLNVKGYASFNGGDCTIPNGLNYNGMAICFHNTAKGFMSNNEFVLAVGFWSLRRDGSGWLKFEQMIVSIMIWCGGWVQQNQGFVSARIVPIINAGDY